MAKRYLIKLSRLASEKTIAELKAASPADDTIILPTDQDNNFVYFMLPDGSAIPDLDLLYTPNRSGLKRYTGLLSNWETECEGEGPPPDPGAPTFVRSETGLPQFVDGDDYEIDLYTTDTAMAIPATGTTITKFSGLVLPPGWSVFQVAGEPTHFKLRGHVSSGVTEIKLTLEVEGSNGKKTAKAFTLSRKPLADRIPRAGLIYFTDKVLQILVAPSGQSTAPTIQMLIAPVGYNERGVRPMNGYGTAPQAILDGLEGKYRIVDQNPPSGHYIFKLIHNGYTRYGEFDLVAGTPKTVKITLVETDPSPVDPNPVTPAPQINPIPLQTTRPGQLLRILLPPSQFVFAPGQALADVQLTNKPTWIGELASETINGIVNLVVNGQVPATQPNGIVSFGITIKQTDGQPASAQINAEVSATSFYAGLLAISATNVWPRTGPTFVAGSTVQITSAPAGFTDLGVKPLEAWGTSGDGGREYKSRFIGYNLSGPAGPYVFKFVQGGTTLWALYNKGTGSPVGSTVLELSATEPQVSQTPDRFISPSATSINEGGNPVVLQLKQTVNGVQSVVSGATFRVQPGQERQGVSITGNTLTVLSNSVMGDSFTLPIQALLGGDVYSYNMPVNDTTTVAVQQIVKIQTKRLLGTPLSNSDYGILVRIKTVNGYVPKFNYSDGGSYVTTAQMWLDMPAFTDGEYQYGTVIADPPKDSGLEYITVGYTTSANTVIHFQVNKGGGNDADWVTQYESTGSTGGGGSSIAGFPGDSNDYVPSAYADGLADTWAPANRPDIIRIVAWNVQPDGRYQPLNIAPDAKNRGNKYQVNNDWVLSTSTITEGVLLNYWCWPDTQYIFRLFDPIGARNQDEWDNNPTVNGSHAVYRKPLTSPAP